LEVSHRLAEAGHDRLQFSYTLLQAHVTLLANSGPSVVDPRADRANALVTMRYSSTMGTSARRFSMLGMADCKPWTCCTRSGTGTFVPIHRPPGAARMGSASFLVGLNAGRTP
jgi:hypothetical protein